MRPDGATGARTEARVSADASPLVLCVDTATDAPSVAVARGARIIAVVREPTIHSRSSVLLAEIDAALGAARVSLGEIELYAVARGPGSFTGLRTGLATIKAFASVGERPVAAIPTLRAVALSAGVSERTLALVPAGRGEVYAQTLRADGGGRVAELSAAAHASLASLLRRAATRPGLLKIAGGAARTHAALIRTVAEEEGIELIDEASDAPERRAEAAGEERVWVLVRGVEDYAAELARLSLISYVEGETLGAQDVAAVYVRPSDAELNERCHR